MAELFNFKSNQVEKIEEGMVDKAILTGDYGFKKGERIPVVSPEGTFHTVPAEKAFSAFSNGYRYETLGEQETREARKAVDFPGAEIVAGAAGVARGVSFGLSDQLLTKGFDVDPKKLKALEEENPTSSILGETAGVVGPALLSGGTSLVAKGATKAGAAVIAAESAGRLAGKGVSKIIGSNVKSKLVKDIAIRASAGAVEGSLFGFGQLVSEEALGDAEFNAESVIATLGASAILGGAVGGSLAGVSLALKAGVHKLKEKVGKSFEDLVGTNEKFTIFAENQIKKSEAPILGGRKAFRFKKMTEGEDAGLGVYTDKSKRVVVNPEKIEGRVFNFENLDDIADMEVSISARGLQEELSANPTMNEIISKSSLRPDVAKKRLSSFLSEFDVIKTTDEITVPRNGVIDNAVESSLSRGIKTSQEFKGLKSHKAALLKFAGAGKRDFEKMDKKTAEDLFEFIKDNVSKRNTRGGKLYTALDNLNENIGFKQQEALEKMNSAIAMAEDRVAQGGDEIPGLTGESIARYLDDYLGSLREGVEGKVSPSNKTIYNKIKEEADFLRNFSTETVYDGAKLKTVKRQKPLSIEKYRDLRMKLDDKVRNFDNKDLKPAFDTAIKRARFQAEENLIKSISELDGGEGISALYKLGKKEYELAKITNDLVQGKIAAKNTNNAISLTGFITGAGGLAVGGAEGAMAAIGLRSVSQKYGDLAYALAMDKIEKSRLGLNKDIIKSIKGFTSKQRRTNAKILNAPIKYLKIQGYEGMVEEIGRMSQNLDMVAEKMSETDDLFVEVTPNTIEQVHSKAIKGINFLQDKLPKNPHDTLSFKDFQPSDSELRKFERYRKAVESPKNILNNLENGYVSPEEVEVLKSLYPAIYSKIQEELGEQLETGKLDFQKRLEIFKLFGIQTDQAFKRNNISRLQASVKGVRQEAQRKTNGIRKAGLKKLDIAGREKTNSLRIENR